LSSQTLNGAPAQTEVESHWLFKGVPEKKCCQTGLSRWLKQGFEKALKTFPVETTFITNKTIVI